MTLEEALKQINFSTSGVSAENFKKSAVSVNFFENCVRRLNLDTVQKGFSSQNYDREKNVYIQVKHVYENLSPLALMNVSKDSLIEYETYSKAFAAEEAKFGKTLNRADEFCKQVKSLSVFALNGNQIPTVTELDKRDKLLSELDAAKQSLQEGKVSLPQDILNKLSELHRNVDALLAPWYDDFTGKAERKDEYGNYYAGDIVKGVLSGSGKMYYADGEIYNGEWKDGWRSGNGTHTYNNGDEYNGEWANDEKNGFGKMTYCRLRTSDNNTYVQSNKSVYVGHWKSNKAAPTVQDTNYAEARHYLDNENYKSAQKAFEKIEDKSVYPDVERLLQICKNKLAEIERKRAEEERKIQLANKQKRDLEIAKEKRAKREKRGMTAKQTIVDLVFLLIAVGLEFLAVFLFERYLQTAYFLLVTPLIWILYSSYTEEIEDIGHYSNDREITITFKVLANIINAVLLTTYIFVCTNPVKIGWTIVMLVVNTIITIVLSLSVIIDFAEMIVYDWEMIVCDWSVIALIVGYLAIVVGYILNKELIDYYCYNSSFWHTLWVLPVVQIAMALVVYICWKIIEFDLNGGMAVLIIVQTMAVINFIRAMVIVWSFMFSVGMFFFGVLALAIQAAAFFGTYYLGILFGVKDYN